MTTGEATPPATPFPGRLAVQGGRPCLAEHAFRRCGARLHVVWVRAPTTSTPCHHARRLVRRRPQDPAVAAVDGAADPRGAPAVGLGPAEAGRCPRPRTAPSVLGRRRTPAPHRPAARAVRWSDGGSGRPGPLPTPHLVHHQLHPACQRGHHPPPLHRALHPAAPGRFNRSEAALTSLAGLFTNPVPHAADSLEEPAGNEAGGESREPGPERGEGSDQSAPIEPSGAAYHRLAPILSMLIRTAQLTNKEVSSRIGCSASYLSRSISGERVPTWALTRKFAQTCGADPEVLRTVWESEELNEKNRETPVKPDHPPMPAAERLRTAVHTLHLRAGRPRGYPRTRSGSRPPGDRTDVSSRSCPAVEATGRFLASNFRDDWSLRRRGGGLDSIDPAQRHRGSGTTWGHACTRGRAPRRRRARTS
jgi:transcriptional regulator with XRE-family HTH domain